MQSTRSEFLPPHKAILKVLKEWTDWRPSSTEIFSTLRLFSKLEVNEEHDAIIKALEDYFTFEGAEKFRLTVEALKANLRKQKELAQAEKEAEAKAQEEIQALKDSLRDKIGEIKAKEWLWNSPILD